MKTKFTTFLVLYFSFLMVGVIAHSCILNALDNCGDDVIISDKSPDFYVSDSLHEYHEHTDTVTFEFQVRAKFVVEKIAQNQPFDFGISSAYALSCPPEFFNSVRLKDFKLTSDRGFLYDNDSILAGQNLLKIDALQGEIYDFEYKVELVSSFSQGFLNRSNFKKATHKFYLEGKTSDGLAIRDTLEVFIDL